MRHRKRRRIGPKNGNGLPVFPRVVESIVAASELSGALFGDEFIDRDERTTAHDATERYPDLSLIEGMIDGAAITIVGGLRSGADVPARELAQWLDRLDSEPVLLGLYRDLARVHVVAGALIAVLSSENWLDPKDPVSMEKLAEMTGNCCDALAGQPRNARRRSSYIRGVLEALNGELNRHIGSYNALCCVSQVLRQPVHS